MGWALISNIVVDTVHQIGIFNVMLVSYKTCDISNYKDGHEMIRILTIETFSGLHKLIRTLSTIYLKEFKTV